MEKTAIKAFREVNHLKQKEVAEYLGITRSAVSFMERPGGTITNENLRKIRANPYAWDVSMLPKDPLAIDHSVVNSPHASYQGGDVNVELIGIIKEQQAQMGELIKTISQLTKK